MAYVSVRLQDYLKSASLGPSTPVRVAVRLSRALPQSIEVVTPNARAQAIEVLGDLGVSPDVLDSGTSRLRAAPENSEIVTMLVSAGDLESLARSPGIEYIRPVRIHLAHLDITVGMLGVNYSTVTGEDGKGVLVVCPR